MTPFELTMLIVVTTALCSTIFLHWPAMQASDDGNIIKRHKITSTVVFFFYAMLTAPMMLSILFSTNNSKKFMGIYGQSD